MDEALPLPFLRWLLHTCLYVNTNVSVSFHMVTQMHKAKLAWKQLPNMGLKHNLKKCFKKSSTEK